MTNRTTQILSRVFLSLTALVVIAAGISTFNTSRPAEAAYNAVINYQGKLTNASNVAVADGLYNMEFELYDALGSGNPPTGGNLLWTETRTGGNKVQVTNGVFSVMLGEVTAFGSLDFNQTLFLSVNIGGTGTPSWDGDMSPRKKIGTVPTAFLASNLKGTGTIDITNTGTQGTFNYDGSNRATLGVASNGFTTLTAVGSGAGFNLTGGNVGIGTATLSAKLHVTSTTEQLRLGYDVSNYTSLTTSSGGDLTIAPSGSDLAITGNVDTSGTLTAGTGNAFVVNASGVITAGTWNGGIIDSTYGGTGNGFTKFSGPASTEKTFTLPNASATILTSNTAVTPAQGGTGTGTYTLGDTLYSDASNSLAKLAGNTTTTRRFMRQVGNGSVSAAPVWDVLSSADVGLGSVENTALSTWAGTTNVTTVGTIATGTWSATTIAVNKGGTGTTTGSITGSTALTFAAGGSAQNINFIPTTSGVVAVSSSTANTDVIQFKPQIAGTAATFAGIITTADLTGSDKTYTFPNANITVNAAADISGTTLASNVTGSSLTSVGTLTSLTLSGSITGATSFNGLVVTANTGAITTGTWNGTDIAIADGGTGASTSQNAINNLSQLTTNGDLLYHNGTNSTRLARGADTECLKANTTTILWGACAAGGGYATIQDEAGALTQRTVVNFTGAGVACVDNAGSTRTDCTIAGGGSTTFDTIGDAAGNGAIAMGATVQSMDWTTLTTQTGMAFTGPTSSCTVSTNCLTTGTLFKTEGTYAHTAAETGNLANIAVTDKSTNTTGTSTTNGLDIDTTINTSGAGLKQINAINVSAPTLTACASGACTFKGLNVTGGSIANVTSYGAYIDAGTGAGTEYAAAFMNGNVGIGTAAPLSMLQVGAAVNRGDITVYGDLKVIGADIQRSLSGIIDLFVYDTTRDLDGGEWRDSILSSQLSWALESKDDGIGDACVISSDDRCGISAFPRKAIIATTADAVYIFDSADNSLWMKFTQVGTYALGADTNNNPSGVGAQNGVVVVGTNGASATGMYAIDFKQDVIYRYNTTDRRQADINIGNRNSTATYTDNAETGFLIIDNAVNDVSIAVQTASNEGAAGTLISPIDSQAGPMRGVTIIAAATDSGVAVINMGTRKVITYSDVTGNDYNQVVMTSRGRMYATNEALAQLEEWKAVDTVSVTQANGTPTRVYDETISKTPLTTGTTPTISTSPSSLAVIERASSARESAAAGQVDSGDIVFVGTNQGLAEIHTSGGTLATASWSKLTTTTVATPYMVGAAKTAFSFDEAAASTNANSIIGTAANNARMDQAGATAPTFGGGGVRGTSVNFNNNSYLCSDANDDGTCDFDSLFNSSTTSFTVSLWFKHGITAASDTLFERCYTPATPTVAVGCIWAGMTSTGTIKIGLDSITTWTYETTYDDSVTSAATYNDNQWHHLVFTNTDTDICLYIDGRQAAACDTALAATATLDASQVLTIGGACSGANCTTGTNYWDGSIDDFVWSSGGGTTADGLTAQSANKLFLDGRAHMIRPSATVTDATTVSATTLGDSGESYVPDSFVGLVLELTGGTGSGQTRTIVSNTATTFTVYPAFSVTPDTTTDYRVSPAKLYGSTNNVTAIGVDSPTSLNKVRKVYIGTNDGADGGGITTFTNAGAGSIKTEVIHSDAGYSDDDLSSSWSGSGADNITALASYSETLAMGTGSFLRMQRKDASLKQLQTETLGALEDIRMELVAQSLFGSTQDVLGLGQGADLAEYYYSTETLDYGDVVVIDKKGDGDDVVKSSDEYSRGIVGIVATRPGMVLGEYAQNGYPVALTGRVPVKFSYENGAVQPGDYLTTSSIPGYAMRATGAGPIVGKALVASPDLEDVGECPESEDGEKCANVLVFVEHGDYSGPSVEQLIDEMNIAIAELELSEMPAEDSVLLESGDLETKENKQDKILAFLKKMKAQKEDVGVSSQILTDRLSATFEVISPSIVADGLQVLSIGTSGRGIDVLGDLHFIGRPYFNADTAGFAKILQGNRYVDIIFEKPYLEQPTVTASITQEQDTQLLEEINQQMIDTANVLDDARVELLFGSNIQHLLTRKNQNGFRIILNKPAPQDITFSWIALAVKNPRLVISTGDQLELPEGEVAGEFTEEFYNLDDSYESSSEEGFGEGNDVTEEELEEEIVEQPAEDGESEESAAEQNTEEQGSTEDSSNESNDSTGLE